MDFIPLNMGFKDTRNDLKKFGLSPDGETLTIEFGELKFDVPLIDFVNHVKGLGIKMKDVRAEDLEYFVNLCIKKKAVELN